MSAIISRSRVSSEQLELLLSFMEEHRDFAANKQAVYSRFSACKLWRLLAERLNAAAEFAGGGAHKTPDRWCRFWADIKYKARRKSATGGVVSYSNVEERVQKILGLKTAETGEGGASGCNNPEEDPKVAQQPDDDMYSEGEGEGGPRIATDELLAEAAMRSALAAEKQAEAVTQAVDLLRELVGLMRERALPAAPPHAPPPHAPPPHAPPPHAPHAPLSDHTLAMHHHHRL